MYPKQLDIFSAPDILYNRAIDELLNLRPDEAEVVLDKWVKQYLLIRLTQQHTRCSGSDFGPNLRHPWCSSRPNSSALYNCRYVGTVTDIPIDKTR